MTVIRPNSISGVTSITAQGGDITYYKSDGTAGNQFTHNIQSTGVITATKFVGAFDGTTGTFSGNLGVGGVLTYEDVTNIDSVGLITARGGINLTGGNITLGDSGGSTDDRIKLGASGDLEIYHSGSHSHITDAGTGGLKIRGSQVIIDDANGDVMIQADQDGSVDLYHNGSKKLETSSSGAIVTGDFEATNDLILSGASANLRWDKSDDALEFMDNGKAVFGNGDDLKVYHGGTHSEIINATNELRIRSNDLRLQNNAATHNYFKGTNGGAAELYHNNVKQLETNVAGITLPKGGIYGMGGSMVLLGGIIDPSADRTWKFPFNTNHAGTNNGYEFTIEIVLNHWNHGDYYKILERYLFGRGNTTSYQTVTKIDDRGSGTASWNTSHFDQVVNLSGGSSGFPAALEITYDSESAPSYTSGYHIFVRHSGTMGIPVIV